MFFIKRYKVPEKQIQTSTEKTNDKQTVIEGKPSAEPLQLTRRTRILIIVLFSLILSGYNGLETTFLVYASTYCQYIPLKISASKAAQMTSILSATYTAGRGVSALITTRVRSEIMLSSHLSLIGASLAILYWGQNSELMVYIGMATLGQCQIDFNSPS